MDIATKMLEKRFKDRVVLGQFGRGDSSRVSLDVKVYSQNTVEVLSNPESRHRIVAVIERLARLGKLKAPIGLLGDNYADDDSSGE